MKEYLIAENENYTSKGETSELTEEEIDYYLNNPDIVVEELLKEEQGEEYLDYIYTTLITNDSKIILEKAKPLITDEQYNELYEQAKKIETTPNATAKGIFEDRPDYYSHLMAGAAVTAAAACVVYYAAKWFQTWIKISTLLVIATALGILAGLLKEVYDYFDPDSTSEMGDFFFTTVGSVTAGILTTAFGIISYHLKKSFILAGVTSTILAVYAVNESGFIPWFWKKINNQ